MLKAAMILAVAVVAVAGALFYMASRIAPSAVPEARKIGPAMESRPYPKPLPPTPAQDQPQVRDAASRPAAPVTTPPAAAPEPAPEPVTGTPDPARPPTGRYPKGFEGCDRYKSYDPATQTFKTLDGRVMPCRVQ